MTLVTVDVVMEQSSPLILARLKNPADGSFVGLLSKVNACELKIWEKEGNTQVGSTIAITPANNFFDALQVADARWTKDLIGYNFKFQVTPAMLPKGGRTYRLEFKITAAITLLDHWLCVDVPTDSLYSA